MIDVLWNLAIGLAESVVGIVGTRVKFAHSATKQDTVLYGSSRERAARSTEPLNAAPFEPERFPIFVLHAPLGRYYGFPGDRREGFKIGKYHLRARPVPDPDCLDRECSRSRRARGNRGLLPGGERPHPPHGGVHVHHQRPDEHFILDRHPAMDDAFIAAGFSGHGYKFCSVIGRVMAV